MSIILSDSKIKKLQEDLSSKSKEDLIKLLIEYQKSQDEVMKSMMKQMNDSLKSLNNINLSLSKKSDDTVRSASRAQEEVGKAIKTLSRTMGNMQSFSVNDLDRIATKIANSVNPNGLTESLNEISNKLEPVDKEWLFQVRRDIDGRMYEIQAKQTNIKQRLNTN